MRRVSPLSRIARAAVCAVALAGAPESAHAATYLNAPATFAWIDPSSHTNVVWTGATGGPAAACTGGSSAIDDDISDLLPLGFTYTFGGVAYTSVRVMSNGRLQFNNTYCGFGTQSEGPPRTYPDLLPDANVARAMRIYGGDLDASAGGTVRWASLGTAPDRSFVVTFTNVPEWTSAGSFFNLQIILRENGDFIFQYGTSNNLAGGKGQIGWELDTTDYDLYAFTSVGLLAGTAVRYSLTAPIAGFRVGHDRNGVNCLAEPVTVVALGAGGATLSSYAGQITLDTQAGSGDWASGAGNAGILNNGTAGDGVATYQFSTADAGDATFLLTYAQGASPIDVDAFETGNVAIRDDDAEGTLAFAPSGFTVTSAPVSNPPPSPIGGAFGPQTAGAPFTLYLTAFGQTPTDPVCGVIESYTGSKALKFWTTAVDPTPPLVNATVNGTAVAASQGAATAQTLVFTSGQASVSAKYKDVGRIQISGLDDTAAEPAGGIRGATNALVVRPADFVLTSVRRPDGTVNPGGATAGGAPFVAAGDPFAVTVEVRDAEGSRTPSYGREAVPEGVMLQSAALVAPAGGRNGTGGAGAIGNAAAFSAVAPAGTFSGATFYFDEVGAIQLRVRVADASYLGAGDVAGSVSAPVGRFLPHHFDVAPNAPVFATACSAGGFTYLDQDYDYAAGQTPLALVTARNTQGGTTENYAGAFFKLAPGTLTGIGYASVTGTLSPTAPAAPAVADLGRGVGSIAFTGGPPLHFVRAAPVVAFDAEIALSLGVIDADGVAYPANPARFGQASAGNGIAFSNGKSVRYGRLGFENAYGSELVALPMPLRAEVFTGGAFVPHAADRCTTFAAVSLLATKSPTTLATASTVANQPLAAGDAGLMLSAPGVGNTGTVDFVLDLGATPATGANLPWLRFDWDGNGSQDNPAGRATFGVYSGDDELVHLRELY